MLQIYRRHRLVCGRKSERYRRCQCPIYVEGSLAGESIRKSLDLTSWEAAADLVAQWNAARQIGGIRIEIPNVAEAVGKHITDAEARNLQPASVKKIRDHPSTPIPGLLVRGRASSCCDNSTSMLPREFRNELVKDYSPNSARKRFEYTASMAAHSSWDCIQTHCRRASAPRFNRPRWVRSWPRGCRPGHETIFAAAADHLCAFASS